MSGIKRIVFDILIPTNLPIEQLSLKLSLSKGVEGVDLLIEDVEHKVESARLTIEGENLDFSDLKNTIHTFGASLQSVDRVSAGKRIIE